MIKEAIILAGGLGTRLRDAVPDLPKCMAPVNGVPFIGYVIEHLKQQGVERFIFSLGYKHTYFNDYLLQVLSPDQFELCIEEEPLGTGGAIQYAAKFVKGDNVIVTNGDTLFKVDIAFLSQQHISTKSHCTLSLKPMTEFDRYGVVEIDDRNWITSFKEKKYYQEGLINGGVYALNVDSLLQKNLPLKFSFEKDYLEAFYTQGNFHATIQEGYFIDIGIPEDYEKAARDLKN
ncbi:MAG: nucleotidyltransferase family protein [Bacteroidota bacterium]